MEKPRMHSIWINLSTQLVILCSLISQWSFSMSAPTTAEWVSTSVVSASGLSVALGLRFVATPTCKWCKTNSFDLNISRALVSQNTAVAATASDVLNYGAVPALALASIAISAPGLSSALRDSLIVITSAAVSSAITETIKISARRKRPQAVFDIGKDSDDNNRSFLSGHTSFSFSVLTSATVLAFKNKSRFAPLVATLSALTASSVGFTRILAAKHWTTDVVAGMGLGILVGAAMPFLVLPKTTSSEIGSFYILPEPTTNGLKLAYSW